HSIPVPQAEGFPIRGHAIGTAHGLPAPTAHAHRRADDVKPDRVGFRSHLTHSSSVRLPGNPPVPTQNSHRRRVAYHASFLRAKRHGGPPCSLMEPRRGNGSRCFPSHRGRFVCILSCPCIVVICISNRTDAIWFDVRHLDFSRRP